MTVQASPVRRMGPAGSEIWTAMLEGAEDVLREEGYAALTSRRVAERIGVKQRLVYYYFASMDDLIAETFKRLAARELERLSEALAGPRPLREIWDVFTHTEDTRLTSEFMALSNRSEPLRKVVKEHIKKCRKIQVKALSDAMAARGGGKSVLPPSAAILFATGAALLMRHEEELGIRGGHAEALAFIKQMIESYEAP